MKSFNIIKIYKQDIADSSGQLHVATPSTLMESMQLSTDMDTDATTGSVAPIFVMAKGASTKRLPASNLALHIPSPMIADTCQSASKRMRSDAPPTSPEVSLKAIMDKLNKAESVQDKIMSSLLSTGTTATQALTKVHIKKYTMSGEQWSS